MSTFVHYRQVVVKKRQNLVHVVIERPLNNKLRIMYFLNTLNYLIIGNSSHIACCGRNSVINTLSATIGQKNKVGSGCEVAVPPLTMTIEIVTVGVRNFPLICIGCGSNRLNDKERNIKIQQYYKEQLVQDHKLKYISEWRNQGTPRACAPPDFAG